MYHHSVDVAKTHKIMAKFRPIVPRPPPSQASTTLPAAFSSFRARTCKARKHGGRIVPLPNKRQKTSPPPLLHLLPNTTQLGELNLCRGLPLLPKTPTTTTLCLLVEQDLLKKLQEPRVFAPQPVRPVGSSISVGNITESSDHDGPSLSKNSEEVESSDLPVVISDSKNRARLANSAYKEMVGQPECPWLDSMVESSSTGSLGLQTQVGVLSRRINGEVVLDFGEASEIPAKAEGFSCRVKVEWACNGKKSFVDAPCDVMRLYCDSKDYLFSWKIYTAQAFATNCKA